MSPIFWGYKKKENRKRAGEEEEEENKAVGDRMRFKDAEAKDNPGHQMLPQGLLG